MEEVEASSSTTTTLVEDNVVSQQPLSSPNRELKIYRRLLDKITFDSETIGLYYRKSLMPGVSFYRFLAKPLKTAVRGEKELLLQMYIPDTIVYRVGQKPLWIYSDKDGYVHRDENFTEKHVLQEFQSSDNLAPVAIRREETISVVSNKNPEQKNSSSSPYYISKGNKATVLYNKELQSLLKTSTGAKDKHLCLQKFVAGSNATASIIRAVHHERRPVIGWLITNRFSDTRVTSTNDFSVNITELKGAAIADIAVIHTRLLTFIESALRRHFELLVADYIKSNGQYYLLQVKCFRLRGLKPGQALGLSPKLLLLYSGKELEPTCEDERRRAVLLPADVRFNEMHDAGGKGYYARAVRAYPCKFCNLLYPPSELPFRMTLKMIHSITTRIKSRRKEESESTTTTTFGIGNQRAHAMIKECVEAGPHAFVAQKDSSTLYHSCRVCTLCHEIYEKEQELVETEKAFSAVLGSTTTTSIKGTSTSTSTTETDSSLTFCRVMFLFQTLFDMPQSFFQAQESHVIESSKLYFRFEFLGVVSVIPLDAHAIIESPTSSLNNDKRNSYWLPLHLTRTFHFFAPSTPLTGKVGRDDDESGLAKLLCKNASVKIDLVRCSDPGLLTPASYASTLQQHHHLSSSAVKSSSARKKGLQLLPQRGGHVLILGTATISLSQFRSSFVSKNDYYVPLKRSGSEYNLKGSIALDRIRTVKASDVKAMFTLSEVDGVYVPAKGFATNDPVCQEWLEHLPSAPFSRGSATNTLRGDISGSGNSNQANVTKALGKARNHRVSVLYVPRAIDRLGGNLNDESSSDDGYSDNDDSVIIEEEDIGDSSTRDSNTWCVTVLLHQTHNLKLRNSTKINNCKWQGRYSLFSERGNRVFAKDDRLVEKEIVFNSSHKHFCQGSREQLVSYFERTRCFNLSLRQVGNPIKKGGDGLECEIRFGKSLGMDSNNMAMDGTFDIAKTKKNKTTSTSSSDDNTPFFSASIYITECAENFTSALAFSHVTETGLRVFREKED